MMRLFSNPFFCSWVMWIESLLWERILTLDHNSDQSFGRNFQKTNLAKEIHIHIFIMFMRGYGLCEIWRFTHPKDREYSFYSPAHNSYTRINYFIIPISTASCDYLPQVISDHAPIPLSILQKKHLLSFYRSRVERHLLHNSKFEEFI